MIEILHFVQNDREEFRMTGRVPDDWKGPDDRRVPMAKASSDKHLLRPWRFLQ